MTLAHLPTPPMGWNSWNTFGPTVDEALIRQTADALVSTGLRDLGYRYVNIDDHWQGGRNGAGRLVPHPERFAGGIGALADYVHERGLKLGIYSDAAELTCGGEAASLGREELDAETFAAWQVDYLKYDYCHAPVDRGTAVLRYTAMGRALQATGRDIVYSVCEWGGREPWLWAAQAGGQLWRTTGDICDSWHGGERVDQHGIDEIGFDLQRGLERFAGPGRWNDPDLLVVGMGGRGHVAGDMGFGGCSVEEYRTHFSLWCMLAAPLIIGADVRSLDETTAAILSNREVIALNQDGLGRQGWRAGTRDGVEIWLKPLLFGDVGVALFNRTGQDVATAATLGDLGLHGEYGVRDLWAHEDLPPLTDAALTARLPGHGCAVYRLTPHGTARMSIHPAR
ncbi:glycoside hydrolase family 27 protein [Dactylosporangium siamense]|uniref:Alpha-galactosidase n=1 Tax=Dactylosporangium siamense TaxID=685454 RepID=A0A919PRH8_9ACTN|nr:glycoside hydrolase family 27 protein [Dactylosporangium siamense]GIG48006.1 alpha-galactosidase [Dactylosporangium siamense]